MNGVILVKERGQEIDKKLLETVAKLYPVGWGVSAVGDDALMCQGAVSEDPNTAESLATLIEDFKDDVAVLYAFDRDDDDLEAKDMQPYVVFSAGEGEEATPYLNVFLTGKFEKYEGLPSKFAYDYLIPAINKLHQETAGIETVEQVCLEMETNSEWQNEVLSEAGEGAIFVFHAKDVKPLAIVNEKAVSKQYTWGTAYNSVGLEPQAMGKPAATGKKTIKTNADAAKGSAAAAPALAEPPKFVKTKVPFKVNDNQRRVWLHKRLGSITGIDWKTVMEIDVPYARAKELGDLDIKDFRKAAEILAKEEAKAKTDKQTTQPAIPLVTTEDRKKAEEIVKNYKIPEDPATYKDMEEKMSSWSDQRGVKIEDTFLWPFDLISKLPHSDLCALAFQWRKIAMAKAAPAQAEEPKPKKTIKAA